jgi:hypothetical protein
MLHPRRDQQHLALAHDDLLAVHQESQRALQRVGHLLGLVLVHRDERAALQVNLRQHLLLASHDLPRDHLRHFLERDLVPPVQADPVGHGEPSSGAACDAQL